MVVRSDASLEELLETLGADVARHITEAPTDRIPSGGVRRRRTRESLEELRRRGSTGAALEIADTIGVGGEGVVRSAIQLALHREVAVKKLRGDRRSDEAQERLLAEACIAGLLEHPDIVPVYDLHLDENGDLLIVYKKIDGESWADLIADPAAAAAELGVTDHLEFNLSVLIRVCDAVAYAHDRGIVHRDLKPANVMLGRFGEVCLTDWGVAAAIDDRYLGRIPRLGEDEFIIGTPAYMAPEMFEADGAAISPLSDVYLLGSVLYECLAGHPPHKRDSLEAIIESIRSGPPELDEAAPLRLRQICARAMATRPGDRFPGAAALGRELAAFVRERGSLHILERATSRLADLRQRLRRPATGPDEERMAVYRLFAECRFGFGESAAAYPEAARQGLRQAVSAVVDYELARGAPEAAEVVLAELEEPPADAAAAVAAAGDRKRRLDERIRAYAEVGRRHDPHKGNQARRMLALVMALAVVAPQLTRLIAWHEFGVRLAPAWAPIAELLSLVPLVAFVLIFRRRFAESAITRALTVALAVGMAFAALTSGLALALGWNQGLGQVMWMFTSSAVVFLYAFLFATSLLPTALAFAGGGVLVALHFRNPEYRDWLALAAETVLIGNIGWLLWIHEPTRQVQEPAPEG